MSEATNPYGKAKKGESKAQASTRRAKFYHEQRLHAEETGDQGTSDKINRKLGRKPSSVDANAVDKGILGTVATVAGARLPGAASIGRGAAALGERAAQKMIPAAEGMARQGMKMVGRQGVRKALPAAAERGAAKAPLKAAMSDARSGQKALPRPKGPSPKMQHTKVRAGSPRSKQSTSRNAGTNPRALSEKSFNSNRPTKLGKDEPKALAKTARAESRARSKKKASS